MHFSAIDNNPKISTFLHFNKKKIITELLSSERFLGKHIFQCANNEDLIQYANENLIQYAREETAKNNFFAISQEIYHRDSFRNNRSVCIRKAPTASDRDIDTNDFCKIGRVFATLGILRINT